MLVWIRDTTLAGHRQAGMEQGHRQAGMEQGHIQAGMEQGHRQAGMDQGHNTSKPQTGWYGTEELNNCDV